MTTAVMTKGSDHELQISLSAVRSLSDTQMEAIESLHKVAGFESVMVEGNEVTAVIVSVALPQAIDDLGRRIDALLRCSFKLVAVESIDSDLHLLPRFVFKTLKLRLAKGFAEWRDKQTSSA